MARSEPEKPVVSLERERELTIELLSDQFAHDNLTLDELESRIEQAYRASSVPALRDIVRDLRSAPEAAAPTDAPLPEVFAPERDRIVSVMTQTKRRGLWQPPRHLDLWSVMSETHLDLTRARLSPGVTEIHLHALMTAVKIVVSPGVRVVVQPSAFLAEVSDEALDPPPVGSNAPVVRITGTLIMSELKVRVRTRELESGQEP